VGFPASGERDFDDLVEIGRAAAGGGARIALRCIARSRVEDVRVALDAVERSGYPFEVAIFIGSSNVRKLVEGWSLDAMVERVRASVGLAVRHRLAVMFVTEDTTRAHPATIRALYDAALDEGATRLCLCDTVGHATPAGVRRLVEFVRREVVRDRSEVEVWWHGHDDRGLAVANALAALETGASGVEGTALGVGERAGNAAIEQLLALLHLRGRRAAALHDLVAYARAASQALGYPIPVRQPIVGDAAFSTGSGIHTAAIKKALEAGRPDLARIVYAGLDPALVGREIEVRIGKMAGRSSVVLALRSLGIQPTPEAVRAVLTAAKAADRPLRDEQIARLAR
jgi:2-isopropylmalate synthase